MRRAHTFRSLCLTALLLLGGGALAAQERVGEMVLVRKDVWGTPAGAARAALALGDPVLLAMEVATGRESQAEMTFDPEGALQLGPEAKVVIDRAVLTPGGEPSLIRQLIGKLLVALSPSAGRRLDVETPAAVIGIRGTVVGIEVLADGTTIVTVLEGDVEVRSRSGGARVVAPGFRTVVRPGRAPTPPAPIDPGDWTYSAAAGGAPFALPQDGVEPQVPVDPRSTDPDIDGVPGGPLSGN